MNGENEPGGKNFNFNMKLNSTLWKKITLNMLGSGGKGSWREPQITQICADKEGSLQTSIRKALRRIG